VSESFKSEVLASLQHLKLPLKEFICSLGMRTEEHIFKQLLQVHAETLEELFILKLPSSISYLNFPFGIHLPHLVNLTLSSGIVTNLNFLKQTPALKRISVGVTSGRR